MSKAKLEEVCEKFNVLCPIGTEVHLRNDLDGIEHTRTRSLAWVLGEHSVVVMVEGRAGGYDVVDRISPVGREVIGLSDAGQCSNTEPQPGFSDERLLGDMRALLGGLQDTAKVEPSRQRALAVTNLEQAIMWLEAAA